MKPRHFLLSLLALFACITTKAAVGDTFTAATTEGVSVTYKIISDNTVMVGDESMSDVSISPTTTGTITIPSTVENAGTTYTVTQLGFRAFHQCESLTTVNLPSTITTFGQAAFARCTSLTTVNIPEGITSISNEVFWGCTSLASITLPASLTSLAEGAFYNCPLTTVTVNATTPPSCTTGTYEHFTNAANCTLYVPNGSIESYSTADVWKDFKEITDSDHALKSYTITAKSNSSALLDAIGGDEYTSKIYKLKLSGTINSYDMMIMGTKMTNLTDVDLSDVTIVANSYNYGTGVSENNVFPDFLKGKYKIKSVILPNSITSIGDNALQSTSITNIIIPASVTSIGSGAFGANKAYSQRSQLASVEFAPSSQLTTLGNDVFYRSNIESFIAPSSLKTLGSQIFKECTFLSTVILPEGVESIGGSAFAQCTSLSTINLPQSITNLGGYAFQKCTSLTEITLPKGLTTIASRIFDGCTSLTNITIQEGVQTLDEYAFEKLPIVTITLPQSLISIGQHAFDNCKSLESIVIPNVSTIKSYTFYQCSALNEVKLSPMTETIETYAFRECSSLKEIHLPPYLKEIANNAFYSCTLNTIYAYMPDVISIGAYAFPNMSSSTLYIPSFLFDSYYYDKNWKNFLKLEKCDLRPGDYESFYTNGDIIFEEGEQRITEDTPIAEIGSQGGIIVQGEAQQFDTVDQTIDDMNTTTSTGASLIGDGETVQENNLPMNELRVKMTVQAKKWYFFCFPFDVTIEQCEYPGRYAWRYYDGAIRATNGSGGWQPVTGETLTARQGYAFQSETAGTLVVKFNAPTFGGNRVKELVAHAAENAAHASWNFIGNPYSSYYDFRSEDITSPITIWNGSSYVAYRPGDDECHLKPYQAFFVQKPTASVKVTFNVQRRETYRQSEATKAARQAKRKEQGIDPKRRLVNLQIMDGEEEMDRARIVLNNEAQHAYELECDAAKFLSDESKAQLYSVEGGLQMAINERPQQGDIRLGYTAKKAGRLSISAPRMDMPMVLVDKKLGITFDLTLGTYDFDTQAGTFDDRFLLSPSKDATAINQLTDKTGVCLGMQDGGLAIGGAEGKLINVYTTGGAQVASHTGNGFVALKGGIYVVKVDGESVKVSVK